MHPPLRERALGRWRAILPLLGVDARYLTGKHTACPICGGGKDRFLFDNKDNRGTWICHQCTDPQAGDGVALVMAVNRIDFKEAATRIEGLIGGARVERPRRQRSEGDNRAAMNRLWTSSEPVRQGDPVWRHLHRRTGLSSVPICLRTASRVRYEADPPSYHPAMITMVVGPDGKPATLHRTYLTSDGQKANVEAPRRIMPGAIPKGSSVWLAKPGDVLGIAEGIETALAASSLFGVPCWAALNSTMLASWIPPDGVREVVVFGDNDPKFGGAAAAYTLAHRLAVRGLTASVEIPSAAGDDWNDVLLRDGAGEELRLERDARRKGRAA
jgi:putative DNA primase/helicase